ncbi:MAG: OmpA family protein [Actinomadura rubrobrunea]|nr:OmpA family protein [Actinomadura rubrobrunea]
MRNRKTLVAMMGLVSLVAAGCGGVKTEDSDGKAAAGSSRSSATATPTAAPGAGTPEPKNCPRGGKLIPAVEIPAVRTEPVHIPEARIGGEVIPAVTIPGVNIPAQRVPAQCVIVHEAPGGCLGAVEIPPTMIPAVEIPAVEIPGVDAGGIHLDPVRHEAVRHEAVYEEGVSVPEVCQEKPGPEGGYVPSIYRSSLYRGSLYRGSLYRGSLYRPRACNDEGECIPSVTVPSVTVPGVSVPGVSFPGASLRGRIVGRTEVFEGKNEVAFRMDADVLFEFGKADIRPQAAAELAKVAAAIKKEAPADAQVRVDGHTDAKGDAAANLELSRRRAQAVADWLAARGGIPRSRLKVTGYGETKPAAPNTNADGSDNPRGRAENRRVVISVGRD